MLKIGQFTQDFPKDTQVFLEAMNDFTVISLDKKGNPTHVIATSKDRQCKFFVREDCTLKILQPETSHMSVDARSIRPAHEVVSSIPVEIDVDLEPVSLEQKIKAFCAHLVQHEFGRDSAEVDQFEESFDYEIEDDDDIILTGHEVVEMKQEEPIQQEPPQEPPPEPTPEPPPEPPPETPAVQQ